MFRKPYLFPGILARNARFISSEVIGPFNWINGVRCEPTEQLGVENVLNPATGRVLAEVPRSGKADIEAAVEAAAEAYPKWSSMAPRERGRLLTTASRILAGNLERVAKMEVQDAGKPIWEARLDVESAVDALEYFGGVAPALQGSHIPLPGGSFAIVQREPLGVVGGIGAWNYPIQTCSWKLGPALAAGNTLVYKPSEWTPVNAVVLGEVLKEAGVPDGVFNVVQGAGKTGKLLCEHPSVVKLSFTGSISTGRHIMAAAAQKLVPITLELGGKSPLIIFDDADMKNAVKGALLANFLSQGEVCSNGTRVYVQKRIYQKFLEEIVKSTKNLKIGDPLDESTTVGATIHPSHGEKVLGFINRAVSEGGKIECGGERVRLPPPHEGGYFLSPCILTGLSDKAEAVTEEIFGAVMCVMMFETEEEVVQRANDSIFGLSGGVFTKDIQRAHRVANAVKAGTFWINNYNVAPVEMPFGGFRSSGIGRENSMAAFEHYTQLKAVYVEMGDVDAGMLMK